jgi:sugar phosphate isomerase/epimerase
MRPLSVSTALFDGYDMAAAIGEIARAGAQAVEPAFIRGYVDFDESAFTAQKARTLCRTIEESGLRAQAVSAHMDLSHPDAREMLARRIAFAADIGAPILITNAGPTSSRAAILDCLEAVLPDCETLGVVVALENPGHGASDLLPSRAAGSDLIARIGSPFLRLNYDVGNVFTYSGEATRPEDDLIGDSGEIVHMHLKDVASSAEGWQFTPIGRGAINYAAIWQVIPEGCPVGIELPLRLERPGRRDPVRRREPLDLLQLRGALVSSLAFLRELEAACGALR